MKARFLDLLILRGGNVLLIYDSSDDLNVVQHVVPSCSIKIHVIITTRCRDHALMQEGKVIQLPELDEDAAVDCFRRWAGIYNKDGSMSEFALDEIRSIVTDGQVKLLPLAIRRVATLMKKTGATFRKIKETLSLKKEMVRYLEDDFNDILHGNGLLHLKPKLASLGVSRIDQILTAEFSSLVKSCNFCTIDEEKLKKMQDRLRVDDEAPMHWDLDLAEVASRSQVADKILRFASLMDTSAVPTDVIRAAVLCDGESSLGEHEFESSLYLLSHEFSLLTFNDEEQTCDIHALVQRSVTSHTKRRNKLLSSVVCLTKCIQDMLPKSDGVIKRNLNNSKLIALAPHVFSVCDHILKLKCIKQECLMLLKISCWLSRYLYDITTAKHLAEGWLQIRRRIGTRTKVEAFELSQSEYNFTHNCSLALQFDISGLLSVGDAYDLMSRPDSSKPYFEEAVQVLEAFGVDDSFRMSYGVGKTILILECISNY